MPKTNYKKPQTELSMREKQVIELIATGLMPTEVARKIHRSVNTVSTHIGRVKRKLGARSTIHAAVLYAMKIQAADLEYLSWGKPRA